MFLQLSVCISGLCLFLLLGFSFDVDFFMVAEVMILSLFDVVDCNPDQFLMLWVFCVLSEV